MLDILKLKNVTKSYPSGDTEECIIKDISFEVRAGEIIALVGPSGSGKSTILQIAGLLDSPTSGLVFFESRDCLKLSDKERTKIRGEKIGFVYQFHYLLSDLSVINNIILPKLILGKSRKQAKKEVEEIIEQLNIVGTLGKNISGLSGGERQRIAIARALANDPRLILADEPTGSLDHKHSLEVFSLFLAMARTRGAGVIIVTHDKNLAQKVDKILDLESI